MTEPKRASWFIAVLAVVAAAAAVSDAFFSESVAVSELADALVWFLMGAMCYRFVMFPALHRAGRSDGRAAGSGHSEGTDSW